MTPKVPRAALLLAAGQAVRVAGPGLALLVLAAVWKPAAFGAFASHYALASLLAFLPATGLAAFILDRSAREPGRARANLRAADRLLATALCAPLAAGLGVYGLAAADGEAVPFPLYAAMAGAAFVEVRIASLRAGRDEAAAFAVGAPANLALLAAAALLHPMGAAGVAAGWLAVRAVQLAVAAACCRARLPPGGGPMPRGQDLVPFLASQSAGVLYAQADTLLVRVWLGEAAAGIYSAALRLLQLASQAAQVLGQWFQPRLAAVAADTPGWLTERLRLRLLLAVTGAGGLAAFGLFAETVVGRLFGPAYAEAALVLALAGPVLAARCLVAAQWIELTARRAERYRAGAAWLLLLVYAVLVGPLALWLGAAGAMLAHLGALAPVALWSGRCLSRSRQR